MQQFLGDLETDRPTRRSNRPQSATVLVGSVTRTGTPSGIIDVLPRGRRSGANSTASMRGYDHHVRADGHCRSFGFSTEKDRV